MFHKFFPHFQFICFFMISFVFCLIVICTEISQRWIHKYSVLIKYVTNFSVKWRYGISGILIRNLRILFVIWCIPRAFQVPFSLHLENMLSPHAMMTICESMMLQTCSQHGQMVLADHYSELIVFCFGMCDLKLYFNVALNQTDICVYFQP
jgi:hypothetical protein